MSWVKFLLKFSAEVLDTYNSSTHGVEEHVENWLTKKKVRNVIYLSNENSISNIWD